MAHPRRFRFGLMANAARSGRDLAELARHAEDLGYATLFVSDHFVDHPMAPMPSIAAAAMATTSLRIGTLVLANDYRHPVVLAKEAATVDLLSDGRLELGIGAGWMTVDYEKAGITLDRPSVRIARLDEAVTVIKGLLGDGPFTFEGQHYRVADLDGDPKPVQRPHPPLIIGGGGRAILEVAARHAQIVGINANLRSGAPTTEDSLRSLTGIATDEKVDRLLAAAGDGFDDLEIQTLTGFVHVTDDPRPIAEGIAAGFGVDPDVALQTPAVLVGSIERIADEVRARRERWHMSYVVVPDVAVDTFAPVVARLAGT